MKQNVKDPVFIWGGGWNRETSQCGTRSQGWKSWDLSTRYQIRSWNYHGYAYFLV